jgi:2-(1,2-epoxy-1,2-dihydrophenyl)acetyl-CoA isomerase
VIGPGRAADLLLFPRSIKAQEAYELGIANRVVPADSLRTAAQQVARMLAEGPTMAYAAIKEAMAYGYSHSLAETLDKEDELQTRAGQSEDHAIAVQAFVNKETPKYLGR